MWVLSFSSLCTDTSIRYLYIFYFFIIRKNFLMIPKKQSEASNPRADNAMTTN